MATDANAAAHDIDRSAPVQVREEIRIDAPIAVVFALHTDVAAWISWRTDIDSAAMTEPFAPGATFEWSTAGLDIASTIAEVDAPHRTVWGGPANGIDGVHVWSFVADGAGTRVVTEESWAGEPVEADVDGLRRALGDSLKVWLTDLERAAESAARA